MTREIDGFTLEEWKEMPWWPSGRVAQVTAGFAGHDREIVVNIDGYDHPFERAIPEHVVAVFAEQLPDSWKVESRSTRIEVHPSGHFAGGYERPDLDTVKEALERLDMEVDYLYDREEER